MPRYSLIPSQDILPPPHPVRVSMDETKLEELASSIRVHGILCPLIVVPDLQDAPAEPLKASKQRPAARAENGARYRIVAGHRRYLAGCRANLLKMPCMVYDDGKLAEQAVMLTENLEREELTPYEEGVFFLELVEKHSLTEEQLFKMVGRSQAYVYPRIELVRGDPDVAMANGAKLINLGVATELNKVTDEGHRRYLLHLAKEGGATIKVVSGWVSQWRQSLTPGEPGHLPIPMPSPYQVSDPPMYRCFMCGQTRDPENMMAVWLHRWEKEIIVKFMKEAGIELFF
jgi:ParB/RepB/Spo0J family partition protein